VFTITKHKEYSEQKTYMNPMKKQQVASLYSLLVERQLAPLLLRASYY